MFSKLYGNVFGVGAGSFNADENYYIVLLNFAKDAYYSGQLQGSVEHYISKNAFDKADFELSAAGDSGLGDYLRQRPAYRFGQHTSTCFVLVFDYEDNDISEAVSLAVKTLSSGGFMEHGDRLMLALTMPEDKEKAGSYMRALEGKGLSERVRIYAFAKRKHQESKIIDNICGALLLNHSKRIGQSVEMNFSATNSLVEANILAFPEEGKKEMEAREEIFWSTLSASYNDDKMDFLRYYVYKLYCNAAPFNKVDITAFCDEFFYRQVNVTDNTALMRRLEHAVKMIPRVTTVKVSEEMCLQNYFNQCYDLNGFGGDKVVELTLKVNLRMHKRFTELMVVEAARSIFDKAKQYHSPNIYGEVLMLLNNYIEAHTKAIEAKYYAIQQFIKTDNNVEVDLPEYIRRYIDYDGELKKQEFWKEVIEYIEQNPSCFEPQISYSREMLGKIDLLKRELAFNKAVNIDSDNFLSFAAHRLINAADDFEICNVIKGAYDRYVSTLGAESEKQYTSETSSFDPLFSVVPSFCKDYTYSFSVGGTFSVDISQRIGKYLVF